MWQSDRGILKKKKDNKKTLQPSVQENVEGKRWKRWKRLVQISSLLPLPQLYPLVTQEPLMPSALPTEGALPVPGGGQRLRQILRVWARSQ